MHKKILAVCAAVAFSAPALAQEMSYQYAELSYEMADVNSVDADGFSLKGAYALDNNLFVLGGYSVVEDEAEVAAEYSGYSIGVGYHAPIMPGTDWVASLTHSENTVEVGSSESDYDVLEARLGVRSVMDYAMELSADAIYSDSDVGSGEFGVEVGARYYFNDKISSALSYQTVDEYDSFSLSLRVDL